MEAAEFTVLEPSPTLMARAEELALLEKAHARHPANAVLQRRLALAYFAHDQFDAAAELLEDYCRDHPDAEGLHVIGLCLLARETEADTARAMEFLRRATAATDDQRLRSFALAALGQAQQRLGLPEEARVTLAEAIDLYPGNKDAFRRLSMLHFREERPGDALRLAEDLIEAGHFHARALAVTSLALAKLGDIPKSREAFGLDRFLAVSQLPTPEGWPSLEAFNDQVAAELLRHPGYHFGRYGAASTQSWRVDDPTVARCKALRELQRAIAAQVNAFVRALPAVEHPWLRGLRHDAGLHGWAVISEGEGYEEWHVHQNGWLSGAYYVAVPDEIAAGATKAGCIAFGLPELIVGEEAQARFGLKMVRPQSGLLMLFPSHCYHRTFAHSAGARRICFAFDVAADAPAADS